MPARYQCRSDALDWLPGLSNPCSTIFSMFGRSITYDVGSKDESFEWMNVHRAPPSLVRPTPCGVAALAPVVILSAAGLSLHYAVRRHV